MPIKGITITMPDGALLGWQAECPACSAKVTAKPRQYRGLYLVIPRCLHYSNFSLSGDGEEMMFYFENDNQGDECEREAEDDAKEREREREIDTRTAEELDHDRA